MLYFKHHLFEASWDVIYCSFYKHYVYLLKKNGFSEEVTVSYRCLFSNKFKQNYLNVKFFLSLLTNIKHTHIYMHLCIYTEINKGIYLYKYDDLVNNDICISIYSDTYTHTYICCSIKYSYNVLIFLTVLCCFFWHVG